MLSTYDVKVTTPTGEEATIALRLNIASQFALKKRYKDENALTTLLTAIDDVEKMCVVLSEALNYKGNTNAILTGEELYDALVDEGYAGPEDFGELLMRVAHASGLIKEKQLNTLIKRIHHEMDEALDTAEEDEKNA